MNTVATLELEPAYKFPSTSVRPLLSVTADLEESTGEDTRGIGGGGEGLTMPTETIYGGNTVVWATAAALAAAA